jgi:hypothetical protein
MDGTYLLIGHVPAPGRASTAGRGRGRARACLCMRFRVPPAGRRARRAQRDHYHRQVESSTRALSVSAIFPQR